MAGRWFRNFWLKVGLLGGAGLGTLGFYGLIQAHPLSHSANGDTGSTETNAAASPAPSQSTAPSNSNGTGSSLSPGNSSRSQQQAPPAPIPQRRMSRGS